MTVPTLTVAAISLSLLAAVAIPIALFVFFYRRCSVGGRPFWVGCGVMLLFAFLLESMAHSLILSSPLGAWLQGGTWRFALYGGLMAGLFEETGRLVAFRTLLSRFQDDDYTALMYGAGHGGFEALAILGLGMASNLMVAILINTGSTAALTEGLTGEALASVEALQAQLASLSPGLFLLGIVERLLAVTLHLSFSVLVWFAVKGGKGQMRLYLLAIALHTVVDTVAAGLNGVIPPLALELVLAVITVLVALTARRVWQQHRPQPVPEEPEEQP